MSAARSSRSCVSRSRAVAARRPFSPRAEVGLELADEGAERPPELDRPADRVAVPERELARDARRRTDDHPVVADLLDPPAARAEDDDVAVHPGAQLVDHLLVELADAAARRAGLADHEDAVETAIRDRAAARDRDDAGIAPAFDDVGDAVPDDARLELGELVGWIGAGEHPEDALEDLAGQCLVRRGALNGRQQVIDRPAVHHGHRDQLLSEDVQRVAGDLGRFDGALVHPAGHDRALEEVAAVLREDDALAGRPDLVAGAADALEAAGDARRALDLDDEVDRAHVDAELEAGRGDQRRQPAGLQLLLDEDPLLARDAAVVGPDELLAGQLVEPLGEPLGEAAAVGEDDRAAMAPDELEDPRVDRRPDARPQVAARRRAAGLLLERQDLAHRRHVVDRDDDLEVERLARPGIDDGDVAVRADAAQEPGDRLERPLRGGQADPLHRTGVVGRAVTQRLQALEAEGEVGATLGAGDRVDLVDDHVLDAAQDLAGGAGQHQVERFGGGDEDVRRAASDLAAVLGRRVAGPAGDRDVRHRLAQALGGQGDPGERRPEVALDVVGQRLERRDVQDADEAGRLAGRRGARVGRQTIEATTGTRRGFSRYRWVHG